jgi:hypothetical protein
MTCRLPGKLHQPFTLNPRLAASSKEPSLPPRVIGPQRKRGARETEIRWRASLFGGPVSASGNYFPALRNGTLLETGFARAGDGIESTISLGLQASAELF